MQIGKAARSNGSHIKSRLKMEPHGVFKEVTKQCTNKDHYQSAALTRHTLAAFDDDSMAAAYACKVAEGLAANKPLTKLTVPRESLARVS